MLADYETKFTETEREMLKIKEQLRQKNLAYDNITNKMKAM